MCPETSPAQAESIRQFVIHDDLKPPQTTSRRADLEMRLPGCARSIHHFETTYLTQTDGLQDAVGLESWG